MHRSFPSRAAWLPDVLLSLALLTLLSLLVSGCAKTGTSATGGGGGGGAPPAGKSAAISDAQPSVAARPTLPEPPAPQREFRGMFVTTAYNIDWPPAPGTPPVKMRDEMAKIIERAKALNINVIMLQVRSHGDRHHRRTHVRPTQPWARGLNKGTDPDPHPNPSQRTYDPLAEWIRACHRNGLELHAWINPFRLREKHATLPSFRALDGSWYLKWQDQNVQLHVLDVIEELLEYRVSPYGPGSGKSPPPLPFSKEPKMFSTEATLALAAEEEGIDGIIIDHYFPPPPDKGGGTQPTQPSTRSVRAPLSTGTDATAGALAAPVAVTAATAAASSVLLVADAAAETKAPSVVTGEPRMTPLTLRELTCIDPEPTDRFLCEVMKLVQAKAGAKLGFSPRHDASNAKRWLGKGLLHYVVPELYFDDPKWGQQLEPWLDANTFANAAREKPIVVAGLHTMRTHKPPPRQPPWVKWAPQVILGQIDQSRTVHGTKPQTANNVASGQAHYSSNSLWRQADGGPPTALNVGDLVSTSTQPGQGQYRTSRLVPACVDTGPAPDKPDVVWNSTTGGRWMMPNDPLFNTGVLFWAVWLHDANGWGPMQVVDRNQMTVPVGAANGIAVKAIDVFNHESPVAVAP